MALNEDAIDEAFDAWDRLRSKARDAEREANEAFTRAQRMAQGKPVDFTPAPQLKPLRPLPSGSGMGPMLAMMERMKK